MTIKYLYMAVTPDKYQLPLAVADSVQQLARMVGVTTNSIYSAISHGESMNWKKRRYLRIRIDEEEGQGE